MSSTSRFPGALLPAAAGERVAGLDLSAYQALPNPLAWLRRARDEGGVRFCWIKSSEGNGLRSKVYRARYDACRALGIHAGPYHFAHAESLAGDPQREAALMVAVAGPWQVGDLRPALDLEESSIPAGMSPMQVSQWAEAFLLTADRLSGLAMHGMLSALYSNPNCLAYKMACTPSLVARPLWLAQYGAKAPTAPKGWPSPVAWQWTGTGRAPWHEGGRADLDLNWWLGNEQALAAWCGCAEMPERAEKG